MVADATNETEPEEAPEEELTLGTQGGVLPIGLESEGVLHRTIQVKPWTLKEERAIGELRDKAKKLSHFQFASMILATLCTQLGANDFANTATKMAKKRLVISQMFLGDVLYAYLWLRRQTLGPILDMDMRCPACEEKFVFKADLDSVPLTKVDALSEAEWDYTLKTPFNVRGKEAKVLTFGLSRWQTYEKIKGASEMKAAQIIGCLVKVDGVPFPLAEHELDSMMKVDLESILVEMDNHHIGPDMSLEMDCPHCAHSYLTSINWSDDDFFGVSGTK